MATILCKWTFFVFFFFCNAYLALPAWPMGLPEGYESLDQLLTWQKGFCVEVSPRRPHAPGHPRRPLLLVPGACVQVTARS